MSRVSIRTPDSRIPNLAAMKLSAWHRSQGDEVVVNLPLAEADADLRYVSYVFTRTVQDHHPDAIVGGTGADLSVRLPDEVEHLMPDYDSWGCDYAIGFASRGCPNRCEFCFVPKKEGAIRANAHPREFVRPDQKHVMFLDNNILAAPNCSEVLEWAAGFDGTVDFNQGLDCRRVDAATARALSRIRIKPYLRFAVDSDGVRAPFERAVGHLRSAGIKQRLGGVFVLVGESGELTEADVDRVLWVNSFDEVYPFAMPYIPATAGPDWKPSPLLRTFARWVNRKGLFRSLTWEEYRDRPRLTRAEMDAADYAAEYQETLALD